MADTIFTRALAQAIRLHGSSQALAGVLRVPESTLLRWVSGRAQMPLRAFHRVIELLTEHEQSTDATPAPAAAVREANLSFNIGEMLARCARCGGTQFAPRSPAAPLQMTSVLHCSSCHYGVAHGALLADLAARAVRHSRDAARRMKSKRPATSPTAQDEASAPSARVIQPQGD
jgi:hypothetical protein